MDGHGWGAVIGGDKETSPVGSSPGDRPASKHIQKQFVLKPHRFGGKHKIDLRASLVLGKSFVHHFTERLKRQGSEDIVLKMHQKCGL